MKKALLATLVLLSITTAYGGSMSPGGKDAVVIFEVREEREGFEERKLISGDWVELGSDLLLVIPEGWFVVYQVTMSTGAERRHGELRGKGEPGKKYPVDEITLGPGHAGRSQKEAVTASGSYSEARAIGTTTEPTPKLTAAGFETPFVTPWEKTDGLTGGENRGLQPEWLTFSIDELKEEAIKKYPEISDYKNPDFTPVPVEETKYDGHTTGFGKAGDTIRFIAFEASEEGDAEYRGKCDVKIVKKGLSLITPDSLNPTPLFVIEFGKKNAEGEKTTNFAPGAGVSYLFFYKHPDHHRLSGLGFGFNFSYSKTQILKEGTQVSETTGVGTVGGVLAYKPSVNLPLFLQGVGGVNLTGSERYGFIAFGIASPVDLKRLAGE
jgi:hypothetical protein